MTLRRRQRQYPATVDDAVVAGPIAEVAAFEVVLSFEAAAGSSWLFARFEGEDC